MKNKLAIIIPCYNEEEVFKDSHEKLLDVLMTLINQKKIASNSFLLYVDDGSKDSTWNLIEKEHEENPSHICAIKFAGNKGHQNAIFSGLMYAKEHSDMTITIDADLQDDINAIEKMVDKYNDGVDVVYGVRNDRTTDSFFKRFTARAFYRLMKRNGSRAISDSADFRLLSKRAVDELSLYGEQFLYLRGIAPELGFKQDRVYYKRNKRQKGKSKYSISKMIQLAFNGITSSNDKPLFGYFYLSFISFLISIIALIMYLNIRIRYNSIDFLILLIWIATFVSGFVFRALAILGQYVGRTYMESKHRPRYYVEQVLVQKGAKRK